MVFVFIITAQTMYNLNYIYIYIFSSYFTENRVCADIREKFNGKHRYLL